MSDIENQLRAVVAEVAEIDEVDTIQLATHLQKELGLNSLKGLEILLMVEENLGVQVPHEALYKIQTFGDILAFAQNKSTQ